MKKNFFNILICFYLVMFAFNIFVFADNDVITCTTYGDLVRDLQNVFDFMKVIIPLLIIGLSSYDFIKAITKKDDKDIKKSFFRLMKRLIFAVIFFFLPVLLNAFLEFIIEDFDVCIK